MKKLTLLALLASQYLIVVGCGEITHPNLALSVAALEGIVGGIELTQESELSKSVVLIRTRETSGNDNEEFEICTGTPIANNIILTAAHCIGPVEKMDVLFSNDMKDTTAEVLQVESVLKHRLYSGENSFDLASDHVDDDIALIKIQGTIPLGYKTLGLANKPMRSKKFEVVSLGYGRSTGVTNLPEGESYGEGTLRMTVTAGKNFNPRFNFFLSDQTSGSGVCHGDSGGPALTKVDGEFQILGITKAIFSTNRTSASSKVDGCKFSGMFMNIHYYQQWIADSMAKLNY